VVGELFVPRRLVGQAVRQLAVDVRRVRVRWEAVLEPHLARHGRLAEAGHVFLRALDAQDHAALGLRQGECRDERQAGVLAGDRQLDQLVERRHTIQAHHVCLDDRAGLGGFPRQLSA